MRGFNGTLWGNFDRRGGLALAAMCLAMALMAPTAQAELRDEPLEKSCPAGYSYGEREIGMFMVEGCNKLQRTKGDEDKRFDFRGDIEVNGLLIYAGPIDGSGVPLTATLEDDTARLHRTALNTKIMLDPLIKGERRRIQIGGGLVDMEVETPRVNECPQCFPDGGAPGKGGGGFGKAGAAIGPQAGASALVSPPGETEIPIIGGAELLGLPIVDDFKARVENSKNDDSAAFAIDAVLEFGEKFPKPLQEFSGEATIKTVDGLGLKLTDLAFEIDNIAVPGIGGFKDLDIVYSADRDIWEGDVRLDLGELFGPAIDFEMAVTATTGALQYMRAEANNLNLALGPSGIVIDAVSAGFITNPLTLEAGADAIFGPNVDGVALVEMSAALEALLEPSFRLQVDGTARVLPNDVVELAKGDMQFVYDPDGVISLSGSQTWAFKLAGIGIGAEIGGRGAISTVTNRFNVEASADGTVDLGKPLGEFDLVSADAVFSSEGWGACAKYVFVKAGLAQSWGSKVRVIGCDLDPWRVKVAAPAGAEATAAAARGFKVPSSRVVGLRMRANGDSPAFELVSPTGESLRVVPQQGRRVVGGKAAVFADPESSEVYVFLKRPEAGRWRIRRLNSTGSQLTEIAVAPSSPKTRANVKRLPYTISASGKREKNGKGKGGKKRRAGVDAASRSRIAGGAGWRKLRIKRRSPLAAGERLQIGIQTRDGSVMPVGKPTARRKFKVGYQEILPAGKRKVIARVLRDGAPVPGRVKTIGKYKAKLPGPPKGLKIKRKGLKVLLKAKLGRRAERPDGWSYVLEARKGSKRRLALVGKAGKAKKVKLPRGIRKVKVEVRPIVDGQILRVKPKVVVKRVR